MPMLDSAAIRARIPHQGRMAQLHMLLDWSDDHIRCSVADHRATDHPLRSGDHGLLAPVAIEWAGQAMALHASLRAEAAAEAATRAASDSDDASGPAAAPRSGFLASVRGVTLHVSRLDLATGPLVVHALRSAGDERQALYRFELHDAAGQLLVDGRCTVVLDGMPGASRTPDSGF